MNKQQIYSTVETFISQREVFDTGQLEIHNVTIFYSNAKQYQNVVTKKSYEIYKKKREKEKVLQRKNYKH